MTRRVRTRCPAAAYRAALIVFAGLLACAALAESVPAMPRVRSENPMIAQLIANAPGASVTFRDPGMTTTQGMFFHFFGSSASATRRFETQAAVEAGIQIERELRSVAVPPAEGQETRGIPRVRSHDPRIVDAIARGTAVSPTLRRLVDTIDATDGIVYVDDGKCGYVVRACLLPLVQVAGPNRLLRIQINLREVHGCELIEVIGHELQHATELLADARIRTDIQAYNFFAITRVRPDSRRFETKTALRMAVVISREACGR